jgi:uncharacterized membrane protein
MFFVLYFKMEFFTLKNIINQFGLFYVNDYPFIMVFWNILLAMAPFAFFLALSRCWRKTKFKKFRQKIFAVILFFFWLIFLPNAAYLITDIRHLLDFCPAGSYVNICVDNAWEIMFFFVYGALGWVFFTIYLSKMRRFLADIFDSRVSKIIILAIVPVMSLGVLLGLMERFNSWDVFVHPLAIFQNLLMYITNWEYFSDWAVFAAGYYILYFFGKQIFDKKISRY